jgi:hypothetical protein
MKLTSPHLRTVDAPTVEQLGEAFEAITRLGEQDPGLHDRFLILECDDGTGAFIQAIAIENHNHWHVEVTNGDEAALRGLANPVSRGRAVEYMTRFLKGERSLGNGAEWTDVDVGATRRVITPVGLAVLILALLVVSVVVYLR